METFFKNNDSKTALEAQYEAQKIAFAPIVFQVARSMRDLGVLECLNKNKNGLTLEELTERLELSKYSIQVLLETSLSADIVKKDNNKYFITKTGYFLLNDEMTKVNMNYNHYVNYLGLYELDNALKNNQAEGLKYIDENNDTIYPALSTLPEKIKSSWFEFDHYYSDNAFPIAINILLQNNPNSILDIGGNTGKFSMSIVNNSENANVTIVDLPEQILLAKQNILNTKYEDRINFIEQNILDHSKKIPKGYDIVWVSQFLDCFDEENIIKLLKRIKQSLGENSRLYIMEPLWDKQQFETSAYCIINTSPYFTAMANGYSKMFNFEDLESYIQKAGLEIEKEIHNIGICQSIIICK
jgi:ubiquinone/menaquinone biosynthesis C-methylase UbiE